MTGRLKIVAVRLSDIVDFASQLWLIFLLVDDTCNNINQRHLLSTNQENLIINRCKKISTQLASVVNDLATLKKSENSIVCYMRGSSCSFEIV